MSPTVASIRLGKRLRYFVEAAGFFTALGFFRLLGLERACALGGWIARIWIAPTGMSKLARANLRDSFPEKSAEDIEAIIAAMWDNLGRVFAEYAYLDNIHARRGDARIEVTGEEHLAAARSTGRGMLIISGHFANWEILPSAARDYGLAGAMVVRPTNNPYVNRWLERLRTRNGLAEIIGKGAAGTRRIFTLLRKGDCVCMLVDQRASEGILAPFFGRDALTTPAPAALALKLGAVILPVSNERIGNGRFRVAVHPMIPLPDTGDASRDLVELTTALNAFIEARVRENPSHWLWIHRRWVDPDAPLRKRAQALSLARGGATKATSKRV